MSRSSLSARASDATLHGIRLHTRSLQQWACSDIDSDADEGDYRLFGFLLGSTLAGASVYYYILEEYKVSNELLTEDIYV